MILYYINWPGKSGHLDNEDNYDQSQKVHNTQLVHMYSISVVVVSIVIQSLCNIVVVFCSVTSLIWHLDNPECLCNVTILTVASTAISCMNYYLDNPTTSLIWYKIIATRSVGSESFHFTYVCNFIQLWSVDVICSLVDMGICHQCIHGVYCDPLLVPYCTHQYWEHQSPCRPPGEAPIEW